MNISQTNSYLMPCSTRTVNCPCLRPIQACLAIIGGIGIIIGGFALVHYMPLKWHIYPQLLDYPQWLLYLGFPLAAVSLGSLLVSCTLKKKDPTLFSIAAHGDVESLRSMLENPEIDLNTTDAEGYAPIHYAALKGNLENVKVLIDRGADPNLKPHGQTVLQLASRSSHELTKFVLDTQQYDVNEVDEGGITAIHAAALGGNLKTVQLLIEKGAHVKCIGGDNVTCDAAHPSQLAYGLGYKQVGDLLLQHEGEFGKLWLLGRMLAHQFFGMQMILNYKGKEISLSGFSCMGTFSYMLQSIRRWNNSAISPTWTSEDSTYVDKAIEQSMMFLDKGQLTSEERLECALKEYQSGGIVVLPAEWKTENSGHATTIIFYKVDDQGYLIKFDGNFHRRGLQIHLIEDETQVKKSLAAILNNQNTHELQEYFTTGIDEDLQLKHYAALPQPLQKGKNCAWESAAKPSFKGVLYARCVQKKMSHEDAFKISRLLYKDWEIHDRKQNIQDFLAIQLESPEDIMVRRQILTCIHHSLSTVPANQTRQEVAKLIEKEVLQDGKLSFNLSKDVGIYTYTFDV